MNSPQPTVLPVILRRASAESQDLLSDAETLAGYCDYTRFARHAQHDGTKGRATQQDGFCPRIGLVM